MTLSLLYSLLASLLLHALLLAFGPDVGPLEAQPPENLTEVELVRRAVPLPEALQLKPLPPVPLPDPLDLGRLLAQERSAGGLPDPALEARLSVRPPGEVPRSRPQPGPPKLNLPSPASAPERLALRPVPPGEVLEEVFQAAGRPGPSGAGGRPPAAAPGDSPARIEEELARLVPLLDRQEPARPPIRGPAASRRILFQPPPPQVEGLEEAEDIVLRFWVLPDGTVGRVLPIRKGSARLEGIAATHLKRWRFSPMPPHEPPREEWGIIAFRFRMR